MKQALCTCLTAPPKNTLFWFCLQVFCQATMVKLFGPIGKYAHYIFPKYTTTYRNNEFYRILDLNFFR